MPTEEKKYKLPILADLVLRADGSWLLRPLVAPDLDDQDTWVSVRQAGKILHISPREVYRCLGEYLVYRRPTRSRIEVSLSSVQELKRSANDPDFWEDSRRLGAYRARVLQRMRTLIASSLQTP